MITKKYSIFWGIFFQLVPKLFQKPRLCQLRGQFIASVPVCIHTYIMLYQTIPLSEFDCQIPSCLELSLYAFVECGKHQLGLVNVASFNLVALLLAVKSKCQCLLCI